MIDLTFNQLYEIAKEKAQQRKPQYMERLEYEHEQITKQGAEEYWVSLVLDDRHFSTNKNGLVLPYLLKLTSIDPIAENIIHNVERDPDMPDIDFDCVPAAKEQIGQYAINRFGEDKVCTVGSWTTYNPKSAHQDVARAMGRSLEDIINITTLLPEDFDNATSPEEAAKDFDEYRNYYNHNKDICEMAFKLRGKCKTQGRHAGGVIISSVPLWDYLPMAKLKGHWTSEWTEGSTVELSKFGFVKYDILGLKTLGYIWLASRYIKENHGVEIDWDDIGYDDPAALKMANELKTDSVFQFDTDSMKSIISKGGVKSFNDLLIYNAMGRPGPMPMIDEYVRRRDDPHQKWKTEEHPRIVELFHDTFGICVYQEELASFYTDICGFTIPQAQKARKAIAKKWKDQLPAIEKRALIGATKTLGAEEAKKNLDRVRTFGRYAFNRAHAVAYCIQAYRCLYLKAHYPVEWWCAVLNACGADRVPKFMSTARKENANFGAITVSNLSGDFAVVNDSIVPGLQGIKEIGPSIIGRLQLGQHNYANIDDFIEQNIKQKTLLERLIKLGAFDRLHPNRRALWYWYQYKYCTDKHATQIRRRIREKFAWNEEEIQKERDRQATRYRELYPKRVKIPKKITTWKPKIKPSRVLLGFANGCIPTRKSHH